MSKAGLPLWDLQADAAAAVRLPQPFVILLFQRPYVWKEDEQWGPLWKDIRRGLLSFASTSRI